MKDEEIFADYNYDLSTLVPKWYNEMYNKVSKEHPLNYGTNVVFQKIVKLDDVN